MKFLIFANAFDTPSGSDTIFSEFALELIKTNISVYIVTNEKGKRYCFEKGIPAENIIVWGLSCFDRFGSAVSVLVKTIFSLWFSIFGSLPKVDIVWSASDFFPDVLPSFLYKIRNRNVLYIGSCYVVFEKGAIAVCQAISFVVFRVYVDLLYTSIPLVKQQIHMKYKIPNSKIIDIQGIVDWKLINSCYTKEKKYDAIFVGRFHKQKCLYDLCDIWELVTKQITNAKFLLIGSGQEEAGIHAYIQKKKLDSTIQIGGLIDGEKKNILLHQAKIFITATKYDMGNIALEESLAAGTPGIIWDIANMPYFHGVKRIIPGDRVAFAEAIVLLLKDEMQRKILSNEAKESMKSHDVHIRVKMLTDRIDYYYHVRNNITYEI